MFMFLENISEFKHKRTNVMLITKCLIFGMK